jgi:hypothetical protein
MSNVGILLSSVRQVCRCLAWLLLLGIFLNSATADQVTTTGAPDGFGPFKVASGGEYTVAPDAPIAALLGAYSPFARDYVSRGTFQTFCVERDEYISPNMTYDVTFNNVTVFTGTPLSVGAAYLYQQFATGNLQYDYANVPPGSRTTSFNSAYTLQHAIWYYMGQYSYESNNPYDQLVNGMFGLGAFAADNGAHGVQVLNLWVPGQAHDPAHASQDVLIYNPVPEPTMFALSGLGLAALLVFRRRK